MNKKRIYIISSTLLLIGLFAGLVQYVGVFNNLYAAENNPGHLWSEMDCDSNLCINTANSRVGIGKSSPQVTLDINGDLNVSGRIKIGNETTCNLETEGSIRYENKYFYGCNGTEWKIISDIEPCRDCFTDPRDGNVYKTVLINGKTWIAENMRYIPEGYSLGMNANYFDYYVFGASGTSIESAKESPFYLTYGVLYSGNASMGACPSGWHLPSDAEWFDLENYFATETCNSTRSATTNWDTCYGCSPAGNILRLGGTSGFNAQLSGTLAYSLYSGSKWQDVGSVGYYWTTQYYYTGNAKTARLFNFSGLVGRYNQLFYHNSVNTSWWSASVRCVKD